MVLQGIINIPETKGENITPAGGTIGKKNNSKTFLPNGAKPSWWQQKRVLLLDIILQKILWHYGQRVPQQMQASCGQNLVSKNKKDFENINLYKKTTMHGIEDMGCDLMYVCEL